MPGRKQILNLVKQYFPQQDPVETVLDWVMDLSTTRVWGATEPNVLGIEGFDDEHLFVLQCLLKGLSPAQMQAALKKEYPAKRARELGSRLGRTSQALRGSMVLQAMLAS